MQRISNVYSSEIELKNNTQYTAEVGYRIYDSSYDIFTNNLFHNVEAPLYSASNSELNFYWWGIEVARSVTIFTSGISALFLLFAF